MKFGAGYRVTDKWTINASAIFASSAFLFSATCTRACSVTARAGRADRKIPPRPPWPCLRCRRRSQPRHHVSSISRFALAFPMRLALPPRQRLPQPPPEGLRLLCRTVQPCHNRPLAALDVRTHPAGMIVLTEAEAAAIRAAFERGGELWLRSSCAGCSWASPTPRRLAPVLGPLPAGSRCPGTLAAERDGALPLPAEGRRACLNKATIRRAGDRAAARRRRAETCVQRASHISADQLWKSGRVLPWDKALRHLTLHRAVEPWGSGNKRGFATAALRRPKSNCARGLGPQPRHVARSICGGESERLNSNGEHRSPAAAKSLRDGDIIYGLCFGQE